MTGKLYYRVFTTLCGLIFFSHASILSADEKRAPVLPALTIVTTDFPPYSFEAFDQPAGLSTEVVLAMLREAGLPYQRPLIQPWARTYNAAKKGKNTLIYSIARSPEREHLFHWIGKVAPYEIYLYKLRSRGDVQVDSLAQAKHYVVGGEYEDIKQAYLVKQGFTVGKNLQLAADDTINLRKLFAGRIDLLPFNTLSLPYVLNKEERPLSALEPVLQLDDISYDLYLAMSINSDPRLVSKLKQALQTLHSNGEYAHIRARYLGHQVANGNPFILAPH